MHSEKGRTCDRGTLLQSQQISWLALSHGTFTKLIPAVALKTTPGDNSVPDFGINLVYALECLNL
jgi:hypothetical protein